MAILVTGASGFLGYQLLNRLVKEKREVVAIARNFPDPSILQPNSFVRWHKQDVAENNFEMEEMPEIEAVVHLAGATLGAKKDEIEFLYANEMTTMRVLQSFAGDVERFVFASSQVVYGDARQLNVSEDFALRPDGSAYACSKLNSENWVRWFHKQHGGQYFMLRFCGFIDGGGLVDYLIDRALNKETIELYSNGAVRRDYLPSSAAIDALISAIDCQEKGDWVRPVNIGSGQIYSALQLAEIVCDELGVKTEIRLLDHPSPQGDFVFNIDRARNMFNFQPRCLNDSIRMYVRMRSNEKY